MRSYARSTTSSGTRPTLPAGHCRSTRRWRWRCAGCGRRKSSRAGRPPPYPGRPATLLPTDPDWAGGSLYLDERQLTLDASGESLWKVIEGIGGDNGWYSFPLAWAVRGWLDRFVGGVGLRRGRRDAERLRVGDSLDFWRVEEIDPGRLLRLRAEMRLPGLAWLEMYAATDEEGRTRYRQRALFHPRGLLGHAYWWSVSPFHAVVFGGMARNITQAAAKGMSARRATSHPDRIRTARRDGRSGQ